MGLRGAVVQRITATADVDPHTTGELVLTFTVEVAARTGRRWEYGTGPLPVHITEEGDELTEHFDFLAKWKVGELLDDVYADGYDGLQRKADFSIEWTVSDAARESWHRAAEQT